MAARPVRANRHRDPSGRSASFVRLGLAGARGQIASSLVSTYRALGGGWQLREGNSVVNPSILDAMRQRFLEEGVWVRPFADVIYLMPPLVIGSADLDTLIQAVRRVVKDWSSRIRG